MTSSSDNQHISWNHELMRTSTQLEPAITTTIPTQKVVCYAHDLSRDYVLGGCQDGTLSVWHPAITDPVTSMGKLLGQQEESDEEEYEWWA